MAKNQYRNVDVNFCDIEQLSRLSGIRPKTAKNVIKYRKAFGRFNTHEELLRIPDLGQDEYKILAKQFKDNDKIKHIPVVIPKVPPPRTTLMKPNGNMVLNGISVNNLKNVIKSRQRSAPVGCHRPKTVESVPSGMTRNGKRYRITHNSIASSKLKPKSSIGTHRSPYIKHAAAARKKACVTESMQQLPVNTKQKSDQEKHGHIRKESKCSDDKAIQNEALKGLDSAKCNDQRPTAIRVETTPSGNQINFTCTIDKQLLNEPTSMSFLFNQYGSGYRLPSKTKTTPVSQGCKTLNSSSGSTNSSTLSVENLYIFEKMHTQNVKEKKRRIEDWVSEVNSERSIVHLSPNMKQCCSKINKDIIIHPRSPSLQRDGSCKARKQVQLPLSSGSKYVSKRDAIQHQRLNLTKKSDGKNISRDPQNEGVTEAQSSASSKNKALVTKINQKKKLRQSIDVYIEPRKRLHGDIPKQSYSISTRERLIRKLPTRTEIKQPTDEHKRQEDFQKAKDCANKALPRVRSRTSDEVCTVM